jgi:putative membrane-bound dehydrogenase-like protein
MRPCLSSLVVFISFLVAGHGSGAEPKPNEARWIWYDEGDPLTKAAVGDVWFRTTISASTPCSGQLIMACDDEFVLWVNGQRVAQGDDKQFYKVNLAGHVDSGTNVFCVQAKNDGGPAGLYISGGLMHPRHLAEDGYFVDVVTNSTWVATRTAPEGDAWLKRDFDAAAWTPAKELAVHAESPWKQLEAPTTESYLDRYTLPPGFRIERIAEPELTGSLVNMTWGNRGRLIVSQERGPLLSLIDKDGDGKYDEAIEFSTEVKNCQGICMVFDTLYAVGDGKEGVGMYRMPDKNGDDKADSVELVVLHSGVFPDKPGRIGDHGPHDVVFGPDGWLYHNMGNHARIQRKPEPNSGTQGYYEGNLLEPRFDDARGHDRGGNPVPAGSVWRFTPDGSQWWLESVGYRNQYDVAFNSDGELFTYDADMEWDVGTPWYRPTRINHCVPGGEFGWRSGTAKWPAYYFDSLPETVDMGRGSPTGVVMYEHALFPKKYQSSLLVCDWSRGRILAVKLSPQGGSYTGEATTLVAGNPLNASDIEVDRDGSMIFCTGGRNSEGGVYRVWFGRKDQLNSKLPEDALSMPQLHAAWSREAIGAIKAKAGDQWEKNLEATARSGKPHDKVRALTLLSQFGPRPSVELLASLAKDGDAQVRAFAVWLLGDHPTSAVSAVLADALKDSDGRVQRRACEAFVRAGLEAPLDRIVALLNGDDRWVRYAAREALKRIPAEKWHLRAFIDLQKQSSRDCLLALYQTSGHAFPKDKAMLAECAALTGMAMSPAARLELIRLTQLTLLAGAQGNQTQWLGEFLLNDFPSPDVKVNMETARIIAKLNPPGGIDKLLAMLGQGLPEEQIHYALCLRYVDQGWKYEQRVKYVDWYEKTKTWEGGASFAPFLANIVEASLMTISPNDRRRLIGDWQARPHATRLIIERTDPASIEGFAKLVEGILADLAKQPATPEFNALADAAIAALAKSNAPEVQTLFRKLYDDHPDRRNELARLMSKNADIEDWPYLVRTLDFGDPTTRQMCLQALSKLDRKADKPGEIRTVILTGMELGQKGGGLSAAKVLQRWTGKKHGDGLDVAKAMEFYQQWFAEKYPNERPATPVGSTTESRYSVPELITFLDSAQGKAGDVSRGKQMFAKANCIKCHQFMKEGQGVGPDLTSVRRRFQRKEIVESIVHPSKVISDQYRSLTVQTTGGLVYTGLPVKEGGEDKLTLILPDATKLEIAKSDVDEATPATISVMPENLLRELSLKDVADLFAFLETSKDNEPASK